MNMPLLVHLYLLLLVKYLFPRMLKYLHYYLQLLIIYMVAQNGLAGLTANGPVIHLLQR